MNSKAAEVQHESFDIDAGDDRRRHFRAEIPLKARYLTEPGEEYNCLVSNISAGGALLRAKIPPQAGQSIVVYIDDIGRFEATVIRSGKHTFAVDYRGRRKKTKRTADSLFQALHTPHKRFDRRSAPRIKSDAAASIILEDGDTIACSIRDISLTGASVDVSPQPPLGAQLRLGKMMAKVVRRHETGIGVVFTGSATHMEQVIEDTSKSQNSMPDSGARIAPSFGRKDLTN